MRMAAHLKMSFRRFASGLALMALLWAAVSVGASMGRAEQLPLKSYRSTDGLPSDNVNCIRQDAHGFLWFCTTFGLSRFDGAHFTDYGEKDGLTFPTINDLIETRQGVYWVATNGGGVFRLDPRSGDARFVNFPIGTEPAAGRINALFEDRAGRIWAGADAGLFRLEAGASQFATVALGLPAHPDREVQVWDFAEDGEGSIWIATKFGLVRHLPTGQMIHHPVQPTASGRDLVRALMFDRAGRLWIGHESWLVVFKPNPLSASGDRRVLWGELQPGGSPNGATTLPDAPGEARLYPATVRALCQSADGHVWIGTRDVGVLEIAGGRLRHLTTAQGLSGHDIVTHGLRETRDGSLWISVLENGVMQLRRSGLVTYDESDGLGNKSISFIVADQFLAAGRSNETGGWYVVNGGWHISFPDEQFAGKTSLPHFGTIRLNLPARITDSMWAASRHVLRDHAGEWWVATSEGLYRFPKVERFEQLARARPRAVYTARDGLVKDDVTRLFEDSRGDLWIATFAPEREILARWERATGRFFRYSDRDGLQAFSAAAGFCEDAAGQVWIGFRENGLARYANGRFTRFGEADGVPKGSIIFIYRDSADRLWAATSLSGLVRIDNPTTARPRFTVYADKLASKYATAITEDAEGRIYAATGQGVDRLDPATGQVKHFTLADGLASVAPLAAFRDRQGALWFGTAQGLSRLIPQPDRAQPPPPVFINGLRIAGKQYPVSDFGQAEIGELDLDPSQRQLQIAFFGLNSVIGEPLRYQYKLEGAGQDWSAPTEQQNVELSLSPGRYRFLVRALRPDGTLGKSPAIFRFRILRPVWQRWWFLVLVATSLAAALITAERIRVARLMERRQAAEALRRSEEERLLELERVRRRIATELHDDIGTSLSRIAILTEVVKQQTGPLNVKTAKMLNDISGSARELLDSISDVVWAIDPRRDDFTHIISRLRQFAADVLGAQRIRWEFHVAPEIEELKIKPDPRRQLYLIFKEAINNIAKHAQCASVTLKLESRDGQLIAEIRDDGCGFAPPADEADLAKKSPSPFKGRGGHGLGNMRLRAEQLGGQLQIASSPGQGTHLLLQLSLSLITA